MTQETIAAQFTFNKAYQHFSFIVPCCLMISLPHLPRLLGRMEYFRHCVMFQAFLFSCISPTGSEPKCILLDFKSPYTTFCN